MRRLSAALAATLIAAPLLPLHASAQELSGDDSFERTWFVPRLAGSLSIEISLLQSFALESVVTNHPTTSAGVSVGWRHFFDGHGRLSLRTFAAYERGGIVDAGIEGSSHRIGGGLALSVRGINQNWVFGGLALYLDGGALIVDPPPRPLIGLEQEQEVGFHVGTGLEATFGSLIVLDPYLFVETGASLGVSFVELPSAGAWELLGRWIFRFDVGVREGKDE